MKQGFCRTRSAPSIHLCKPLGAWSWLISDMHQPTTSRIPKRILKTLLRSRQTPPICQEVVCLSKIAPPAFQILRVDHELVPSGARIFGCIQDSLTAFFFFRFLPPLTINRSVPLAKDERHEHEAKVQSMEVSPTGETHLQPSATNPVRAVPAQSGTQTSWPRDVLWFYLWGSNMSW